LSRTSCEKVAIPLGTPTSSIFFILCYAKTALVGVSHLVFVATHINQILA
jgi:hypothetical protein